MEQKYKMSNLEKLLLCGSLLLVFILSILAIIFVIKHNLGIALIGFTIIISILCFGTLINFFAKRINQKEAELSREKIYDSEKSN